MRRPAFLLDRSNFDPRAWRRLDKAVAVLAAAREHLLARECCYRDRAPGDWPDLTAAADEALALLDAAGARAQAECNEAQARAAASNGEYGLYLAFCRRRQRAPFRIEGAR
jgi:hypothetical protein